MNRNLVASLSAFILATAVAVPAAVDPDLVILDAKTKAVSAALPALEVKIAVVDQLFKDLFVTREKGLDDLADARARQLEELLFGCAMDPDRCVAANTVATLLTKPCQPEPPGPTPGHTHDLPFLCPLRELIDVVKKDRGLAEAGGLVRDFATADAHLLATDAALDAGDGVLAFREVCAAYKSLMCP